MRDLPDFCVVVTDDEVLRPLLDHSGHHTATTPLGEVPMWFSTAWGCRIAAVVRPAPGRERATALAITALEPSTIVTVVDAVDLSGDQPDGTQLSCAAVLSTGSGFGMTDIGRPRELVHPFCPHASRLLRHRTRVACAMRPASRTPTPIEAETLHRFGAHIAADLRLEICLRAEGVRCLATLAMVGTGHRSDGSESAALMDILRGVDRTSACDSAQMVWM